MLKIRGELFQFHLISNMITHPHPIERIFTLQTEKTKTATKSRWASIPAVSTLMFIFVLFSLLMEVQMYGDCCSTKLEE